MDRREFLKYLASCSASLALGNLITSCAEAAVAGSIDKTILKNIRIIDTHAHPDQFYAREPPRIDRTSTLKSIKAVGMVASSFDAVGDTVSLSRGKLSGSEFDYTITQLKRVKDLAQAGEVRIVYKTSDVPAILEPAMPTGAILGIEGGDCLEGNLDKLDYFYGFGVRKLTLVHYNINEIGDIMTSPPKHKGLTSFGQRVVESMENLGMVVDVTHAHPFTLKAVTEMSSRPILASHSILSPVEDPSRYKHSFYERLVRRMRSWEEMEMVAKTGGVICTTPIAYEFAGFRRKTFRDWATEILEMKKRMGIEHVGLGTDGGGMLPARVKGYRDVRDLVKLISAMQEVGLSHSDIVSYMGGNFLRVFQHCVEK